MSISTCPHCAKPITLPRGAEPADMVRCPICQSEYMLAEALANAPPELLLIRSLGLVSRDEPSESSTGAGNADLRLFEQVGSHFSDGPTIDLSDAPQPAEEEGLDAPFSLGTDQHGGTQPDEPETVQIDPSAHHLPGEAELSDREEDDAEFFDSPERDTELELMGSGSAEDVSFELDAPPPPFEMGSEDEPAPGAEDPESADAGLAGFGDEPGGFGEEEQVPSLDAAADENAEFSPPDATDITGGEELASTPRRERRKPSMLAGLIIWSTSLPVAAVLAYAILLWAFGKDPAGLGPKVPSYLSFLVPAALRTAAGHAGTQLAQAQPQRNNADMPGFSTNVPALKPKPNTGESPAAPLGRATTPDAADPTLDMSDDVGPDPTLADAPEIEPADEGMADPPADGEPAMAADEASDDDAPDANAPQTGGDAMADTDSPETDPTADSPEEKTDDQTAMDDAPSAPLLLDAPNDEMVEDSTDASDAASPDAGDVASIEPADVPGGDVAAPEEETEPTVAVGPRDNVHYSPDEVETALAEARDAGTALTAADKDGLKKAKAQYYRKLYQLAELATFAASDPVEPEGNLGEIQSLLSEAAADRARFAEMGKAAGKWITLSKGKEHQGVVLSGSVQSVTKQGQVYETKILLTDGAQVVSVLSSAKLPIAANDQVVVLGSIVSDPAKTVEGYQGTEPTAIWSGLALKAPGAG